MGVLFGFLLHSVFQRIQNKHQVVYQKNVNPNTNRIIKYPVATTMKVGINKTDKRKEDAIEILLNNYKNTLTLENYRKSTMEEIPSVSEFINQNNKSVVGEQKQSAEANVVSMSAINSRKSMIILEEPEESPKSNDPQLSYYTNKATVIQTKSHQQDVVKEPEIVNQKKKSLVRGTKKSSKPSSTKELKTIKQENPSVLRELNQSPIPGVLKEPEVVNQRITPAEVTQNESSKSDIFKELETNLIIATTPWSDKLLPFQTSSWDSKHAEDEPLLTSHIQDLIQLYIDVGLANNIVWMVTEFGHRSKELDESYMKLCASIAGRIKEIGL